MTSAAGRLGDLTPDERTDLLDGEDLWRTTPVPRLGIGSARCSDGPHGLRLQFSESSGQEGSQPATCFPPAVALAASWDRSAARAMGAALGAEARARGVEMVLGPGLNLKRSPLCGRNFEYFSEDPLLAGELAGHVVEGLQSKGVGATLKHFAANNQETERMSISVEADERALRELYLAAFERAVATCEPWAVMCSYNRINGIFSAENRWLLTQVLREQWGFGGLVISDWGAVSNRDRSVAAGLDLEMPSSSGHGSAVVRAAMARGALSQEDVDRCARRVLELVDRADSARAGHQGTVDLAAQHEAAHAAALGAPVLLRNDGMLPIDPRSGGPVAVIGELARTPRIQGAGSSQVSPTRIESPLEALMAQFAGGRELIFAPGYRLDGTPDQALLDQAVAAAHTADEVLVFLGLPEGSESESADRASLELPPAHVALLELVAAVNPNSAVVLQNGGVVLTSPWEAHARAILETWLLGQAGGRVVAELLVGTVSPSGKLAETIPVSGADVCTVGNFPGEEGRVVYGERLLVGYRWYDAHGLPVSYPFGHGLSYTTFDLSDPEADIDPATGRGVVSVTVTNTGRRAGAEVVQLYVHEVAPALFRPPQELKGFEKVHLEPGQSARVDLPVDHRSFAAWHTAFGQWVVTRGEFELRLGTSSRRIHHTLAVHLDGDDVHPELSLESPIGDWLDDPVIGPPALAEITGRYHRLLTDPDLSPLYRPIPLERILRFPGFPLSDARAHDLLELRTTP